jgi:CheY-like chemotaxis protein
MPEMNGIELIKSIRGFSDNRSDHSRSCAESLKHIPIIALTGLFSFRQHMHLVVHDFHHFVSISILPFVRYIHKLFS